MSTKNSDMGRVQAVYDIIVQTQNQIKELSLDKSKFVEPQDAEQDLLAEGLMNRVFRVMEEAGHVSEEAAKKYGFETRGILGVRNRLAHAYDDVDREIIWDVIESDFPALLDSCRSFCEEKELELG